MTDIRMGHGYDVHRFAEGRKLILCGIEISHDVGLLGHSDADVATHALMDALLGAVALGDIGKHFPPSDDKYKGASSIMLLERVMSLIKKEGYRVSNVDVTIIAQCPKLAPYIENMRKIISQTLGIDVVRVSVKATTEEGLGFTGAKEGIAAHAVCVIVK